MKIRVLHQRRSVIRTNIELDESLMNLALKISGFKTKKDIVNEALNLYVASLKRRRMLTIRGEGTWSGNLARDTG